MKKILLRFMLFLIGKKVRHTELHKIKIIEGKPMTAVSMTMHHIKGQAPYWTVYAHQVGNVSSVSYDDGDQALSDYLIIQSMVEPTPFKSSYDKEMGF